MLVQGQFVIGAIVRIMFIISSNKTPNIMLS